MKFINFLGSSHLTFKHGLPQTLQRFYSESDQMFKSKYCLKTIKAVPGATYYHQKLLDSFLTHVKTQNSDGQVNVIMLGSNDTREIENLPPAVHDEAMDQFYLKVNNFIESLLSIKDSTIILLSVIIPKNVNSFGLTNEVLEEIVR